MELGKGVLGCGGGKGRCENVLGCEGSKKMCWGVKALRKCVGV